MRLVDQGPPPRSVPPPPSRGRERCYISYGIWGHDDWGARTRQNIALARVFYPGWTVRIYHAPGLSGKGCPDPFNDDPIFFIFFELNDQPYSKRPQNQRRIPPLPLVGRRKRVGFANFAPRVVASATPSPWACRHLQGVVCWGVWEVDLCFSLKMPRWEVFTGSYPTKVVTLEVVRVCV